MSWWALYEGVGEYMLISDEQMNISHARFTVEKDHEALERLSNLRPFSSLLEAKNYLKMHLQGDIDDCKRALVEIGKVRAGNKS
jgi:hypothetical protein